MTSKWNDFMCGYMLQVGRVWDGWVGGEGAIAGRFVKKYERSRKLEGLRERWEIGKLYKGETTGRAERLGEANSVWRGCFCQII